MRSSSNKKEQPVDMAKLSNFAFNNSHIKLDEKEVFEKWKKNIGAPGELTNE